MEKEYEAHIYCDLKPFLTVSIVDKRSKSILEKDFFKKKRRLYKFGNSEHLIDFSQVTHIEFREVKDE